MSIPLQFSRRTTAATAVFACIFIASPMQGAGQFTKNPATLGALQLEYAQLINVYPLLIHQDTANNQADLYAAIAQAITAVAALNGTIDGMMAAGDNKVVLTGMQVVVAQALTTLQAAQSSESDPDSGE